MLFAGASLRKLIEPETAYCYSLLDLKERLDPPFNKGCYRLDGKYDGKNLNASVISLKYTQKGLWADIVLKKTEEEIRILNKELAPLSIDII